MTCLVDGEAASSASYLLQSCHVRAMTRRSNLMVHEPKISDDDGGQPQDLRNSADRCAAIARAMAEQYARRSRVPARVVLDRIGGGKEWWLDWREALAAGFVDRAVDGIDELLPKRGRR